MDLVKAEANQIEKIVGGSFTKDPMIVSVKPMPSSCGMRSRTVFTQLDRPGNATSMVSGTRNRKKIGRPRSSCRLSDRFRFYGMMISHMSASSEALFPCLRIPFNDETP